MLSTLSDIDWATKRRIIYSSVLAILVIAFILYKSWSYIFPEPTCFDNKMNGLELGIDCDGSCQLVCSGNFIPLQTDIVKFFKSGQDTYDILATFKNGNISTSPKVFTYKLDIYDDTGAKIDSVQKTVEAPTSDIIPIYIKDYPAKNISKIIANIVDYKMYKSLGAAKVKLEDFKFENGDTPKLQVLYSSPYRFDVTNKFKVLVILYDAFGSALLVGETDINGLFVDKKDTFNLAWRLPVNGDIKRIVIIPITYNYAQ